MRPFVRRTRRLRVVFVIAAVGMSSRLWAENSVTPGQPLVSPAAQAAARRMGMAAATAALQDPEEGYAAFGSIAAALRRDAAVVPSPDSSELLRLAVAAERSASEIAYMAENGLLWLIDPPSGMPRRGGRRVVRERDVRAAVCSLIVAAEGSLREEDAVGAYLRHMVAYYLAETMSSHSGTPSTPLQALGDYSSSVFAWMHGVDESVGPPTPEPAVDALLRPYRADAPVEARSGISGMRALVVPRDLLGQVCAQIKVSAWPLVAGRMESLVSSVTEDACLAAVECVGARGQCAPVVSGVTMGQAPPAKERAFDLPIILLALRRHPDAAIRRGLLDLAIVRLAEPSAADAFRIALQAELETGRFTTDWGAVGLLAFLVEARQGRDDTARAVMTALLRASDARLPRTVMTSDVLGQAIGLYVGADDWAGAERCAEVLRRDASEAPLDSSAGKALLALASAYQEGGKGEDASRWLAVAATACDRREVVAAAERMLREGRIKDGRIPFEERAAALRERAAVQPHMLRELGDMCAEAGRYGDAYDAYRRYARRFGDVNMHLKAVQMLRLGGRTNEWVEASMLFVRENGRREHYAELLSEVRGALLAQQAYADWAAFCVADARNQGKSPHLGDLGGLLASSDHVGERLSPGAADELRDKLRVAGLLRSVEDLVSRNRATLRSLPLYPLLPQEAAIDCDALRTSVLSATGDGLSDELLPVREPGGMSLWTAAIMELDSGCRDAVVKDVIERTAEQRRLTEEDVTTLRTGGRQES